MRRSALITLLALAALASCGEEVEVGADARLDPTLRVYTQGLWPLSIRFEDARGQDNRHSYEITEPPIETPHVLIEDEVWRLGPSGRSEGGRLVGAVRDEPAPYTRGTPMRIATHVGWRGASGQAPARVSARAVGVLRSTTSRDFEPIEVMDAEVEVSPVFEGPDEGGEVEVIFGAAVLDTERLPMRVDLFELDVVWTLRPIGASGVRGVASRFETSHPIPTSFRKPRDHVRYREVVTWASKWAAGDWVDRGEGDPETDEAIHSMALAVLFGVSSLADEGYRYGRVSRPSGEDFQSWADTLLDKKQAACGEFRGLMIALMEYHGIDARRVWFRFPEQGADHFAFYMTRELAAVGTAPQNWLDTNHSVVEVGGRIYDPTYTIYASSWGQYEDWVFLKFCKGFDRPCTRRDDWCHTRPLDEDVRCIDNPPGFDERGDLEVVLDDPRR